MVSQGFEKEININDLKNETRYHLCRGTTHDEISSATGATLKVRGKWKSPDDKTYERPLHLYITANSQSSLNAATSKIEEIIKKDESKPGVLSIDFD
jgi:hypothetical protein